MKCKVKKLKINSKNYCDVHRLIKIGFLVEKNCGRITYLIGLSKYLDNNKNEIQNTQFHNGSRVIGGAEGKIFLNKR